MVHIHDTVPIEALKPPELAHGQAPVAAAAEPVTRTEGQGWPVGKGLSSSACFQG